MKCYIASGWFTPTQQNDLDNIKYVLKQHNVEYFSPKDECECPPDAGQQHQNDVFLANHHAIYQCDFVVANTRDKDMGTLFEAGVAFEMGKPIIYYCEGLEGPFNLMLAQSGVAVATNYHEICKHVKGISEDINYISLTQMRIE